MVLVGPFEGSKVRNIFSKYPARSAGGGVNGGPLFRMGLYNTYERAVKHRTRWIFAFAVMPVHTSIHRKAPTYLSNHQVEQNCRRTGSIIIGSLGSDRCSCTGTPHCFESLTVVLSSEKQRGCDPKSSEFQHLDDPAAVIALAIIHVSPASRVATNSATCTALPTRNANNRPQIFLTAYL